MATAFTISPTDGGSGWVYVGPYWRSDVAATHTFANVSNLPGEAVSINGAPIVYVYAKDAFNWGGIYIRTYVGGNWYGNHLTNNAFTWYSASIGTGWTVAGLNAASLQWYGPVGTQERLLAQSAQVQGYYDVASMYVSLIYSLGPLLGAALLLSDFEAISRYRFRHPDGGAIVRYSIEDMRRAEREYRDMKRPRFHLDLKAKRELTWLSR